MNDRKTSNLAFHVVEIIYSLVVAAWVLLPLVIKGAGLMPTLDFAVHGYGGAVRGPSETFIWFLVVYVPIAIAVLKIVTFFLDGIIPALADPRRPIAAFLGVLESSLVIGAIVGYVFEYARASSFFAASALYNYVALFISLVFNGFFIYTLITAFSKNDASYQEYQQYKTAGGHRFGLKEVLITPGIQKKLILSFVPLILVIIVILTFILMSNFSNTIKNSVIDNGKLLAERTANVVKANSSDPIAIDDYLRAEAARNKDAALPFKDISYSPRPKTNSYTIAHSTDEQLKGKAAVDPPVSLTESTYREKLDLRQYQFLAPVIVGKEKVFVGYVQVNYAIDVIFESYFRTQVKVASIAAIFIYLSIFLIYILGRNIVFPILYLRMSVADISASLQGMIKGEKRVAAELLQYNDRVPTKDEIKGLSKEVGNMATVIRGIVPYISASTLMHSEREKPMTESKDQCFLFTDIRGFTTLSEGMSPEGVVDLLNKYLDIQASIIYSNHGDVDKFVGDEVMAVFEGDDMELNAVKTGMEIRKRMAEEKEKAIAANSRFVSIGIGINTGPVVFGSVGAGSRKDFTSIGDTVNLAARLEGANKQYGTKTLITEAVYVKVKDSYVCREIDKLTVKGKALPVSVFEVIQHRDAASARLIELGRLFEEGLADYRAKKWASAEKKFIHLRDDFKDEVSATFLERIELFKAVPPPSNWDGVYKMTEK